ncbi:MAG: phenylacetate--CoA ligase family protein [Chloroflexota bacterium]|nr:phenylacetate--CoA ligase family protein [Chloroflexota bacterium]
MTSFFDTATETLDRHALRELQLRRLQTLFHEILPRNPFYARKFGTRRGVAAWDEFFALPFTTKLEIVQDQAATAPYGTNLTYPLERYVKLHQTSGTTGKSPIRVLDTPESWDWWARCWGHVYRGAGVGPGDRVFLAFSFGPFIGFWAAYEGARTVGAMTIPGGGMQTEQRLRSMLDNDATVLCSTPTYALRLAEMAEQLGMDLAGSRVHTTVHAGEPGASVPGVRARIEHVFGARCHDHTGMTELGATGFTCQEQDGVHLIESEFIFEVLNPQTLQPVGKGEPGELVATNLGRAGMPLIRYRTGDLVQLNEAPCRCGRTLARLAGGILGRADDMLVVRGVNVFPSAIEGVLREFPEVSEFRIEVFSRRSMAELRVLVDPVAGSEAGLADQVANRLHDRLLLRVPCQLVPSGSLPRFELKARRVVRLAE